MLQVCLCNDNKNIASRFTPSVYPIVESVLSHLAGRTQATYSGTLSQIIGLASTELPLCRKLGDGARKAFSCLLARNGQEV